MNFRKTLLALSTVALSASASAGGILYTHVDGNEVKPLLWDTSKTIPVYVDGGGAFTYDYDGSVFLSIERANEITARAFAEWSNVPTSTFKAEIAGTIESQIGIKDVNGKNAHELYNQENGYGFWVLYDTDGRILEDYFGVSRYSVLGIAFPEISTEDGEILEATALMNGFAVHVDDVNGDRISGVFTHEFGHAINLSHAQANGALAYESFIGNEQWAGVANCSNVEPIHSYQYAPIIKWYPDANPIDASLTETMYPFIDTRDDIGYEMSTVDHKDDHVAISNLYPTEQYLSGTGTIKGKIYLKDGKTEYPGLVVTARAVDNPLVDVVMVQSGDQTQGEVGLDGSYEIHGLTPGVEYYLYVSQINSGGYPTAPSPIPTEAEYWNHGESNDPSIDSACLFDTLTAQAGETIDDIDFVLNGYNDGIQFTPIINAYLNTLSKNGKTISGDHDDVNFAWHETKGLTIWEQEGLRGGGGAMNKTATRMAVLWDHDLDGIADPAMMNMQTSSLELMPKPEGVVACANDFGPGLQTASIWAMSQDGRQVVGYIYDDKNGDGDCNGIDEINPVLWDLATNTATVLPDGQPFGDYQWARADGISGDGKTILGSIGGWESLTWNNGELINHTKRSDYNLSGAHAASENGLVAMTHYDDGVVLWNPETDTYQPLGGLVNCVDIELTSWRGGNVCERYTQEEVELYYGKYARATIYDMNADATVLLGRGGSFFTGFYGVMYIAEADKWVHLGDFLKSQGVLEYNAYPVNNALAIDARGDTLLMGIAGHAFSGLLDLSEVMVCEKGRDKKVDFPGQFAQMLNKGAKMGRCDLAS